MNEINKFEMTQEVIATNQLIDWIDKENRGRTMLEEWKGLRIESIHFIIMHTSTDVF